MPPNVKASTSPSKSFNIMAYKEYRYDPYVRAWNYIADGGEVCSGDFDPRNNPDDRRKLIFGIIMALALCLLFILFGGCTRRVYVPVERTKTVTEILKDTIVEIKLEVEYDTAMIQYQKDTTSYLSNKYAYSFASIQNGVLGHSIGIFPKAFIKDTIPVKTIIIQDSIPYPVKVEVEKKLTLWQKIKIEYGGFTMGATAALALVIAVLLSKGYNRT